MRIHLEESFEDRSMHPRHSFNGEGTTDNPFRPNAFDEDIYAIAQVACRSDVPQYCDFEGSLFRIHPNGTVEWSHRMPPLREGIAASIENALRQFSGEPIPQGRFLSESTLMPSECEFGYTTEDGMGQFKFKFVRREEQPHVFYDIQILEAPDYGTRDRDDHVTHIMRLRGDNTPLVCRGDYRTEFISLEAAKLLAGRWAEATWKYICAGTRF